MDKKGSFKAERKKTKNIKCYKIGSKDKYPHWLSKAIAQGYIVIKKNVEGLTDVVTFYRGEKEKHFYNDDYIVKLPEGPIIGIDYDKFNELYTRQNQDAWVIDIINKNSRCPEWAIEALNNNILHICELSGGEIYLQFKKGNTYYTKKITEKISFTDVFDKKE